MPFVFVNWLEEEGAACRIGHGWAQRGGAPDGRRRARGRGAHAGAVDPVAAEYVERNYSRSTKKRLPGRRRSKARSVNER